MSDTPKRPGPGRPLGSRNILPPRVAAALDRLNEKKFRIRKDLDPDLADAVADVMAYGRSRLVDVIRGGVNSKKAPSVVKAILALLEEGTEPIPKEVKLQGTLSLAGAVAEAAARIVTKDSK